MKENTKKFFEILSKDEELRKKMCAMTELEEIIALAKELGIELTEADFEVPEGELSSDELKTIAGGGECGCAVGGGGTADAYGHVCVCVGLGMGSDHIPDDQDRCYCLVGGYGHDTTT